MPEDEIDFSTWGTPPQKKEEKVGEDHGEDHQAPSNIPKKTMKKRVSSKGEDHGEDHTLTARVSELEKKISILADQMALVASRHPPEYVEITVDAVKKYIETNAPQGLITWIGQGRLNIVHFFTNMVNHFKNMK